MSVLEINNLVKNYGSKRGVDDISFTIEQGEIFGFIGPNGAGKSTTIRTVLGLIKKNSGTITIFDKDMESNLIESLEKIGYLPSEVFYYEKLKAIDLLRYSANFYGPNNDERIKELATYLELDLNAKIDEMSLGNKKKVGIIQGLVHNPDFIILDEPTSGLDPLMQQKFFQLLKKENERGATILFSSHILSEVQRLCDRVAIIKEGKIITVEKIKTLTALNLKHVVLTTLDKIDLSLLDEIECSDIKQMENVVDFNYMGNSNDIIKFLGKLDILDLVINELDLEDIFMHYYE